MGDEIRSEDARVDRTPEVKLTDISVLEQLEEHVRLEPDNQILAEAFRYEAIKVIADMKRNLAEYSRKRDELEIQGSTEGGDIDAQPRK